MAEAGKSVLKSSQVIPSVIIGCSEQMAGSLVTTKWICKSGGLWWGGEWGEGGGGGLPGTLTPGFSLFKLRDLLLFQTSTASELEDRNTSEAAEV